MEHSMEMPFLDAIEADLESRKRVRLFLKSDVVSCAVEDTWILFGEWRIPWKGC